MNPAKIFSLVKRMAFAVLVGMVVVGCAPKEPQETYQVTSVILEENPEKSTKGGMPNAKSAPSDAEEKYAATLEVTENIKLGNTGTVKVWVGWLKYMQKANAGMARDTTMLYTSCKYARITPSAEGCIIDKEQDILPIDSAGSEAKFIITPQQPTPVFLPGESHGRRSLIGCSPWGR